MKTIIQFPHPGVEHSSKNGAKWNSGFHKRKYLKIEGTYLKDISSKPIDDTIFFWGEWEAQSHVLPITQKQKNYPKNIFIPYYQLPNAKANTDPFIFGNQFYYCICKQGHYPSLRNLDSGSIIFFGSHKDGNFVLDTVFIVKDFIEYEVENIQKIKDSFNDVFFNVSLLPLNNITPVEPKYIIEDKNNSGCNVPINGDDNNDYKPICHTADNLKYRIYRAVMYDDRNDFEGMFSYAPCLPNTIGKIGFSRPEICQSQSVNCKLTQGIKISYNLNTKQVWNEITQQVLSQGLNLMIKTDLPKNSLT